MAPPYSKLGRVAARLRRTLLASGALAAVLGLAVLAWLRGWHVPRRTPERLAALLRPATRGYRPDGPGPFPAVLVLHPCGGPTPKEHAWARWLAAEGFAAAVVDSLGPRGLDGERVCAGVTLRGRERAGDVLVAIADARSLPYVDPSRIVVVAFGHGAWAAMDLLAMDPPREVPTSLTHVPSGLEGVVGLVLVEPYCGFDALARAVGWRHPAPALLFLGGTDAGATARCLETTARLRALGREVDVRRDVADPHPEVSAFLRRVARR